MRKKVLIVLSILILLGSFVSVRQLRADEDYSIIELDKLVEIKNDPAKLAKVKHVRVISYKYDKETEDAIQLIKLCPNLEAAYICGNGYSFDKDFINGLKPNTSDLSLAFQWAVVDFEGVNNPKITRVSMCENKAKHYSSIVNLKNLAEIQLENMRGFSKADYSKLSKLRSIDFSFQRIEDYKDFFQKTKGLKELYLTGCNLTDKDTRYMVSYLKDLERLSIKHTFVEDISFLKDMKKLKSVFLPSGVSNLDILYEMPDIEGVWFEGYTELFVDDELVSFFKKNGIGYTEFQKGTRKKIEKIVDSLPITEKTSEEEKVKIVTEYVVKHMVYGDVGPDNHCGTLLDDCIYFGQGVCEDYATVEYTLLKCVGVDAYFIGGQAEFFDGTIASHGWNEVCIDGKWYGLDATWVDTENADPMDYYDWYAMKPTKSATNEWPDGMDPDFHDKAFPLEHFTANDPMDTLGKGVPQVVKLKLNKTSGSVVCGQKDKLRAILEKSLDHVTWTSSDKNIATVDSKGKITAKMAGTVTITASAAGKKANCTLTVLYKDVKDSKSFWYAPTNYLTKTGVVKGYANQTEFRPANECSRAQMVTFLYRLQGEPKLNSTTCNFTDVQKTDYFYKPVLWAVEKGITTGVSKDKFNPKGICTRAQTVTFLWRMASKPEPKAKTCKFTDVNSKDYFYKATIWASEMKIVAGYDDNTFKPQGKCLRRQMVTFLYKYDKYVNGKG